MALCDCQYYGMHNMNQFYEWSSIRVSFNSLIKVYYVHLAQSMICKKHQFDACINKFFNQNLLPINEPVLFQARHIKIVWMNKKIVSIYCFCIWMISSNKKMNMKILKIKYLVIDIISLCIRLMAYGTKMQVIEICVKPKDGRHIQHYCK